MADVCSFFAGRCSYRYFVAISEVLLDTQAIHVEFNPSKSSDVSHSFCVYVFVLFRCSVLGLGFLSSYVTCIASVLYTCTAIYNYTMYMPVVHA